jgi:hypothetical protein
MSDLFTDDGINHEVLKEYLGDDYYNDPGTNSEPTKMFENVKDRATFVKNYASAQRTISKGDADFAEKFAEKSKGMVTIPGDDASEDDIKAYRKATGVPESVDGYAMDIPDGDDKESFTGISLAVKTAALEAGISADKVSKVWGKVVETMQGQFKGIEDKGMALMASEVDGMKELHKEKYDTFIKGTDEALAKFKGGAEVKTLLDTYGIGNSPVIRNLLAEIAPLVNEGKTVFGESKDTKEGGGFPTYEYDDAGKPTG